MNEILIGRAVSRIDGPAKATGSARYAAEFTLPGMVHAVLVQAPFAAGRVDRLDIDAARSMPGVLAVLRHDQRVRYFGQTVAVVVADSHERATAAAFAVRVQGDAAAPVADMHHALAAATTPDEMRGGADTSRGDLAAGLADAHARIHATYDTPMEFHNPMEPHATLAAWDAGRLTVWTSTQGIFNAQATLAAAFDLAPETVRVICPFVGGGFGSKGRCWPPVILAAHAAREVGRPVRLVLTRAQMYMNNGHRPQTIQNLSLGCAGDGRLTALRHDGFSQMSDPSLGQFTEGFAIATRTLYSCPAVVTGHKTVPTSFSLPTYMRAPGEASGMFALESAIDEMAAASRLDPIAFRIANYADHDENDNKPFASKALLQCYREGAARFGWARRRAAPRALRDGHVLIGMGMASATYPTQRQPSHARVALFADGGVLVQCGTQDLGTGTYTIMMQMAAQTLGAPADKVRVELGDSILPRSGVSGGSTTAASVMPAVLQAAQAVRTRAFGLALAHQGATWQGVQPETMTLRDGIIASPRGTISLVEVMRSSRHARIEVDTAAALAPDAAKFSRHAFGAQFAEVRIDEDFGTIRVSRYTGVFGVGQLLNAKTGRSQLIGGIVYGFGMALLEAARPDPHTAQIMNANLSEYLVPVNADVPEIDVQTIDDPDMATGPLGLKGIGELPIVGVAGAIANAVFNATGKRVRSLPIRIEDVL
ncbi:xanthine dehydrogenase family protein molybdopterin-binding subunit [Lichenicoccus sp.]|uniref:xanthine dehydrogenase family protein molybdopterin-binding subunit n=1 Tax=Lichenicoccus sp. TaxID=2781899 RepID=UPI003D10F17D